MFRVPLPQRSVEYAQVPSLAAIFEPDLIGVGEESMSTLLEGVDIDKLELLERVVFPLARRCARADMKGRTPVIGVTGGPGAGKTTFAKTICATARGSFCMSTLLISLEDFYFTPEILSARGLAWRALPGSHDLPRLASALDVITSRRHSRVEIPRFDMETGRAALPETIDLPVDLCVIEGWLIGHDEGDYAAIGDMVDLLVYLDLPIDELRRSRLTREAETRAASSGRKGMSKEIVEAFWAEALAPGIFDWVLPIRNRSDIVVRLDAKRRILSIEVADNLG